MTGSLRWRDRRNVWEAQVYIGTDQHGKRRFLTRTLNAPNNRTGRRAAERALAELVVEADRRAAEILNPAPLDDTATVERLADEWHKTRRANWSPTTTTTARSVIDRHISPKLGHVPVADIRGHHLDRFYADLIAGGLAPSTVRRIHGVLAAMFRQAQKWDLIAAPPTAAATPPTVGPATVTAPDPSQLAAAVTATAAKNPPLHMFIVLAANMGARRGELCALQWADIDHDHQTVTIRRNAIIADRQTIVKAPKTGRTRTVALTTSVLDHLHRWHGVQQERALAQGAGRLKASGWVFAHEHHQTGPPRPDWPTRAWARLRPALDLEHVRLHDLRHFAATQLLGAGVDVGTVADRLGHSRASTTLDLYRHHLPQKDRDAADVLGAIIDQAGG